MKIILEQSNPERKPTGGTVRINLGELFIDLPHDATAEEIASAINKLHDRKRAIKGGNPFSDEGNPFR